MLRPLDRQTVQAYIALCCLVFVCIQIITRMKYRPGSSREADLSWQRNQAEARNVLGGAVRLKGCDPFTPFSSACLSSLAWVTRLRPTQPRPKQPKRPILRACDWPLQGSSPPCPGSRRTPRLAALGHYARRAEVGQRGHDECDVPIQTATTSCLVSRDIRSGLGLSD